MPRPPVPVLPDLIPPHVRAYLDGCTSNGELPPALATLGWKVDPGAAHLSPAFAALLGYRDELVPHALPDGRSVMVSAIEPRTLALIVDTGTTAVDDGSRPLALRLARTRSAYALTHPGTRARAAGMASGDGWSAYLVDLAAPAAHGADPALLSPEGGAHA